MMKRRIQWLVIAAAAGLTACATTNQEGTLAELDKVDADLEEVYLEDALERAEQSYRRYLEETPSGAQTPEAMRRMADLQIEKAYGVVGAKPSGEMVAPESAAPLQSPARQREEPVAAAPGETEQEFEQRATQREALLSQPAEIDEEVLAAGAEPVPAGPREAIETYKKILENYQNYERNDKVLYQMSRAYDEIGEPDEAMQVMDRLVTEYPYSRLVDEVQFRRGEYFFVRKRWRDAESAYSVVTRMGSNSSFYELALYKLGWTLYKQTFYEEALDNFIAVLDYRKSIGYDFEEYQKEGEEHRVTDTFRVVSLSFDNLGGPEVLDEFFAKNGRRSYADKIYANLGEFYLEKLRYDDAASVYNSFVEMEPYHKVSPHFGMRVIDIFDKAGFPRRVVEAKREFATRYAMTSEYWSYNDYWEAPEVIGFLKTNLTDLAGHYHALYQNAQLEKERPEHFKEAEHWYRELLTSFPNDLETPAINYRLADLLLENDDFLEAAIEYERTAYEYRDHDKAGAAAYAAVFAYRQELEVATGARQRGVRKLAVTTSLRFADTFPEHEQVPNVLVNAADDLYAMKDFPLAIDTAHKLIDRYPSAEADLRRSAWAVVAHSSIDIAAFVDAEHAYMQLLALTPEDDESRDGVVDGLAAAIYKQGEQANLLADYRSAANHFLRIKTVAPTSGIRISAEYDAAAALVRLQDWSGAAGVLEEFRQSHPDHELNPEATKQLAFVYHESGQIKRSASEHERMSAEATDPEFAREALVTAGDLYDQAGALDDALRVYEQYVVTYPLPLDVNMDTRWRMSEIFKERSDYERYHRQLEAMVAVDRDAGADRTDRSRVLAARSALVLAERNYEQFARIRLAQPFEESLALKQSSMDTAMIALEALVEYEVADVTAAATYYIAQTYLNFSQSLIESERPEGLTAAELNSYELVIEEEAYPFEERAIEVHEANYELLLSGVFNPWVQKSLERLAVLMPGRYAKNETSEGLLRSVDVYAYRMPIADQPEPELQPEVTEAGPVAAGESAVMPVMTEAQASPETEVTDEAPADVSSVAVPDQAPTALADDPNAEIGTAKLPDTDTEENPAAAMVEGAASNAE